VKVDEAFEFRRCQPDEIFWLPRKRNLGGEIGRAAAKGRPLRWKRTAASQLPMGLPPNMTTVELSS
jgi:hypothetical protein